MSSVYIIYSLSIDKYYIGSCKDLTIRMEEHRSKKYKGSYTRQADDWELFLEIGNLSHSQSLKMEQHIKRMKSRVYVENLRKYPEIIEKLRGKYL